MKSTHCEMKTNKFVLEAPKYIENPTTIKLISKIFDSNETLIVIDDDMKIYDPACGGLNLLTTAGRDSNYFDELIGQDINLRSNQLNNEILKLINGNQVIKQNSAVLFQNDAFKNEKFKWMVCNPPQSLSWDNLKEFIQLDSLNPNNHIQMLFRQKMMENFSFFLMMISKCMMMVLELNLS